MSAATILVDIGYYRVMAMLIYSCTCTLNDNFQPLHSTGIVSLTAFTASQILCYGQVTALI